MVCSAEGIVANHCGYRLVHCWIKIETTFWIGCELQLRLIRDLTIHRICSKQVREFYRTHTMERFLWMERILPSDYARRFKCTFQSHSFIYITRQWPFLGYGRHGSCHGRHCDEDAKIAWQKFNWWFTVSGIYILRTIITIYWKLYQHRTLI